MGEIKAVDLLTTYWSQVVLLLGGIGFLINRIISIKDKKTELKYSLFQTEKIKAINHFISCSIQSDNLWTQLPYYDILDNKITPKELDEIVYPTHNLFMASYYNLFLFLDKDELIDFEKISDATTNVKNHLGELIFDYSEDNSTRTDSYGSLSHDTARSNKDLYKKIGSTFRTSYLK